MLLFVVKRDGLRGWVWVLDVAKCKVSILLHLRATKQLVVSQQNES